MFSYYELVALVDLHSKTVNGSWTVDIPGLRNELVHTFGLQDYEAQHVIFQMRDKGLLPNGEY